MSRTGVAALFSFAVAREAQLVVLLLSWPQLKMQKLGWMKTYSEIAAERSPLKFRSNEIFTVSTDSKRQLLPTMYRDKGTRCFRIQFFEREIFIFSKFCKQRQTDNCVTITAKFLRNLQEYRQSWFRKLLLTCKRQLCSQGFCSFRIFFGLLGC